ncbi:MAG TPA: hypothetical protein VJ761_21625 [Ktedonobacteraceae bacterium]|nr:hypothetical protein [Ktedonobacteraceae bacterium]
MPLVPAVPGLLEVPELPITITILITLICWTATRLVLSSNFKGRSLFVASFLVLLTCLGSYFAISLKSQTVSTSIGNLINPLKVPILVIGLASVYEMYVAIQHIHASAQNYKKTVTFIALFMLVLGTLFCYLPLLSSPPANAAMSPREVLLLPFITGKDHVTTSSSYKGQITVEVSGVGQTKNSQWSDPFYIFANKARKFIHPAYNPTLGSVLLINSKLVSAFAKPPIYKLDHTYDFTFDAPGGKISFAIAKNDFKNNTGAYTILLCPWATDACH